jgi:hypothetical protein
MRPFNKISFDYFLQASTCPLNNCYTMTLMFLNYLTNKIYYVCDELILFCIRTLQLSTN